MHKMRIRTNRSSRLTKILSHTPTLRKIVGTDAISLQTRHQNLFLSYQKVTHT